MCIEHFRLRVTWTIKISSQYRQKSWDLILINVSTQFTMCAYTVVMQLYLYILQYSGVPLAGWWVTHYPLHCSRYDCSLSTPPSSFLVNSNKAIALTIMPCIFTWVRKSRFTFSHWGNNVPIKEICTQLESITIFCLLAAAQTQPPNVTPTHKCISSYPRKKHFHTLIN